MQDWHTCVVSAQHGDVTAFDTVVRRFQDMAVGYAYSILRDFHQAEDAAQEAFIEAYCNLEMLREPQAFPAWLRRIVFGQCGRVTRKKHPPMVPLDATAEVADPEQGPLEALQARETHDAVLGAVNELPEGERAATALFYIDGYSLAEVGEFLEVPVGTVKFRLHSARKRLRARMATTVEEAFKQHAPGDDFARRVRKVLEGVPRVGSFDGGPRPPEETCFPGCLRGFLEYVGDDLGYPDRPGAHDRWHDVYIHIMGVSGAAFRLSWDAKGWDQTNTDIVLMAADPMEPIRRAFEAVGYGYEAFFKAEYARRIHYQGQCRDGEEYYRRRIVESIRGQGRPVIGVGVIEAPECCVITGVDEGGEFLLGWNYFQGEVHDPDLEIEPNGYFRKRNWYKDTQGLIIIGERRERPTLRESYREGLRWGLEVMRTPLIHGRHRGLAAYPVWAESLLRDEHFQTDDLAVLRARYIAHFLAALTVAEGRCWAAEFLERIAEQEPAMEEDLRAAVVCFRAEHDLVWAIWEFSGGNGWSDDHVLKLAVPKVRRRITPLIRLAGKEDAEAAQHIERALASWRQ